MITKTRQAVSGFLVETGALVTVQVVIFSVMLFAGIGMVIDFGRAYSAHSQMQSYIDNVALAAAAELDQRNESGSTAIDRAINAAFSVVKYNSFSKNSNGGTEFETAKLVFLTGSPTDANGTFDYSLVAGLTTTDASQATHVLAVARPATVRTTLLRMGLGGDAGPSEIPLQTYAVATPRNVTCDGLSTLVMCNPFEGRTDASFESLYQDLGGIIMRLDAEASLGVNVTSDQIGIGLLNNPIDTLGTSSGVCESNDTLPGYDGQTGAALEKLRDTCLLATIETGLSCVSGKVQIKEAPAPDVVTGLNVIWDMFDDQMEDVLDNDLPMPGGKMRSDYFMPDIAAVHARLRRSELVALYNWDMAVAEAAVAAAQTTVYANTRERDRAVFIAERALTAAQTNRDRVLAAYPDTLANKSSRLNMIIHPFVTGAGMFVPACLLSSNDGQCGVSEQSPHPATTLVAFAVDEYIASYYSPIVRELMAFERGISIEEAKNFPSEARQINQGNATQYLFYKNVERFDTRLHQYTTSVGIPPDFTEPDYQGDITNDYVRTYPDNFNERFVGRYTGADYGANERRKLRVSVVNCGSKTSVGSDVWEADVVDVIDLFMIKPPIVRSCVTSFTNAQDPGDTFPCPNEEITRASLYVEYVGTVRDDLRASNSRTYAVLIH